MWLTQPECLIAAPDRPSVPFGRTEAFFFSDAGLSRKEAWRGAGSAPSKFGDAEGFSKVRVSVAEMTPEQRGAMPRLWLRARAVPVQRYDEDENLRR